MTSTSSRAAAPVGRGLVRSGAFTMVGAAAGAGLGFALTLVIARALGPEGSGLLFTATAAFGVAGVAGRLGTDTALVRALSAQVARGRAMDARRTVLIAVVPVGLLTSAAGAVLWSTASPVAGLLLGESSDRTVDLVRVLAVALPFAAVSMTVVGASRGLGDVRPMVLVEQAGKPLVRVVAGAGVGVAGAGLVVMSLAWAVPVVLGCLLAWWLLLRSLPEGGQKSLPASPWRDLAAPLWRFSLPRGAAGTIEALSAATAVLAVSLLAGAADAGVMAGVMRFALVGTLALQAVRLVVAPQLSAQLATGATASAQDLHRWSTVLVLVVSGPAYVCLAVYAGPALDLLGEGFRSGAPALAVLCAAMLFNVATGNVQAVLLMSGRSTTNLIAVIVCLVVHVGLAVLLVPTFGVTGAAVAAGAAVVLENLLYTRVVRARLGIVTLSAPVVRTLLAVLVCFAVPGVLLHLTADGTWWMAPAHALISSSLYLLHLSRHRDDVPVAQLLAAVRARRASAISSEPS